jgi:hypothetical protein
MCSYKITNAESFLQGGLGFKISCFLKKLYVKAKNTIYKLWDVPAANLCPEKVVQFNG